jgi:hypothetical protein
VILFLVVDSLQEGRTVDGLRFDAFAKSFSITRSRRELLAGALAALGAMALPGRAVARRCHEFGHTCA